MSTSIFISLSLYTKLYWRCVLHDNNVFWQLCNGVDWCGLCYFLNKFTILKLYWEYRGLSLFLMVKNTDQTRYYVPLATTSFCLFEYLIEQICLVLRLSVKKLVFGYRRKNWSIVRPNTVSGIETRINFKERCLLITGEEGRAFQVVSGTREQWKLTKSHVLSIFCHNCISRCW